MKPARTMRIGMMFGAGGFMLVVVATGLSFANIGGPIMPTLINLGATVALAGGFILAVGGVRYVRRHREVVGKRLTGLKGMDDAEAGDPPAEG